MNETWFGYGFVICAIGICVGAASMGYMAVTNVQECNTTGMVRLAALPDDAKDIMGNLSCYHADCWEYSQNYTLCHIEIGKNYNEGTEEASCVIGKKLVAIDCYPWGCIKSPRTPFDTDTDEKESLLFYNMDTKECCILEEVKGDEVVSYTCWTTSMIECAMDNLPVDASEEDVDDEG